MRRFFVDPGKINQGNAQITGSEAHHLGSVLRLRPGDGIELFDGTGMLYQARITRVRSREIQLEIVVGKKVSSSALSPVTLAMAMIKGKKMDMLIRRATELGVARFIPLTTRYCENHGRRDRQRSRWQRMMLQACKQCRRVTPMQITDVTHLDALDPTRYTHLLMAWEEKNNGQFPPALRTTPGPVCLLIGPEGGFHAQEVSLAREKGFTTISLGPHILPAETAALAALSIVGYLSGWLTPERDT